MIAIPEKSFTYSIPWKSDNHHLGDHPGNQRGIGFEYRGNVPLVDYPDTRRMDISRSLRDPFEQIQVRLFNQESPTPVYILCDMSSSMQFKGQIRKLDLAVEIAASIGSAVAHAGDVYSFIGYHEKVLAETLLPMGNRLSELLAQLCQVAACEDMGRNSAGVLDVPQYLGQKKSLVFWLSDFHMPLEHVDQTLTAMSAHQVIPVVLWDEHEVSRLPRLGFSNMIDPETGVSRNMFFTSALRQRIEEMYAERQHTLQQLFLKFDSPALYITDDYHPDLMTNYFEQYLSL
ncbi:Protein of unknown function DUF58 [Methylobacillus rhizosphaerae]|uniref:DUF58 domain-containing protein n=1 Tax=Methylobacillus rhizosphaerae TaxID=551994 RepID=A0A239AFA9_9PROT|nr:DUF58 domain-containing protein [Methylobacillus rhizosphaerae]SNR94346.1 Protein of unknown function DUF58 [Methylobacillus rhizosphaerae]